MEVESEYAEDDDAMQVDELAEDEDEVSYTRIGSRQFSYGTRSWNEFSL